MARRTSPRKSLKWSKPRGDLEWQFARHGVCRFAVHRTIYPMPHERETYSWSVAVEPEPGVKVPLHSERALSFQRGGATKAANQFKNKHDPFCFPSDPRSIDRYLRGKR